jgi:hypothetical protein
MLPDFPSAETRNWSKRAEVGRAADLIEKVGV